MKKKHLLIGLLIVALSTYYVFQNVKVSEVIAALKTVHYLYLVPAIFLVALTFLLRAIRWRYLAGSLKQISTARIISPLMIGFMANILPARAGEVIRAYMLAKKEDLSFSASFATIFVERLLDMLCVLAMLLGIIFFSADSFTDGGSPEGARLMNYMIKFGWISFIGSAFILSFSVLLQYKNHWAMKIIDVLTKPLPEKWQTKIRDMVRSFTEGLKILKDIKGFSIALIMSVLVWFAITFTYYPIYMAFGIEAQLPMVSSLIILCLSIAIFISLFPTPAFLGAFQAACVVALHEIFGISKAVAASYGIIAWFVTMGFTITGGLFFVLKDNISFSEISSQGEEAEKTL